MLLFQVCSKPLYTASHFLQFLLTLFLNRAEVYGENTSTPSQSTACSPGDVPSEQVMFSARCLLSASERCSARIHILPLQ